MIASVAALFTAIAFGVAGWLGSGLGVALCRDIVAHDDGPRPVAFPAWPFPVAGAAVGLAAQLHGASATHLAMLFVVVAALAACAASDLRCGMIPDVCSLGALALVLGFAAFERNWGSLLGAGVVFVPFAGAALVSRGRGMGWGDVKIACLGGALLGGPDATLAFILASLAAYIIARRSGERRPIAFGPYLTGSIFLALTLERSV
ncbi:hypothetical protein WPS_22950 [Vulcanimicrobium alpinum]|uniref:Prepilin type IV endopeptidase peptidase domain-containing protein n=1 Tax=Vulcanimicrobium alpinum TaxID=3016050 RepID=A0AAN2CA63_UNVUL|nr:A24 family peptidase [Vulcanimicrobium alpinum]BDE07019.1 hypothetical protein WPS_22950 [Vulcanimicrobium alpinum]